ncbi:hypothetical protein [Alteromonas sp. 14N.309.X.WAT.G.H12]|uniref:hypothetical protein n=1 Tax=Alteromonas sp. 14N.309.X.WAT.G.H12 TaxID=3120824 RepID=UPI002FD77A23
MKNTICRKTFIAMALMSAFNSTNYAFADLLKISDDATLLQQENAQYFSQSGLSGEEAQIVETGGAMLPLSLATSLIIPENWEIKPSGNFDNAVVSWKGGVSWPIIIRNIAENEGVYVTLDWTRKIASIYVPGSGKQQEIAGDKDLDTLDDARQEFRKAQRDEFERKQHYEQRTQEQKTQFEAILEQQRGAQEANQELIAQINKSRAEALEQKEALRTSLDEQREKYARLVEKYSVIDPTLTGKNQMDPTELFKEYQAASVLPYEDSVDYFLKGGHSDRIEYGTSATYIAREGSVHEVLQKWADQIGWYVDYQAGVNHINRFDFKLKGTFREVGTQFIKYFQASDRPLNIDFFPKLNKTVKDPKTGEIKKYHGVVIVSDLNYKIGR